MTVASTLGRGAASGLAGTLAWITVSGLVLGTPDPQRAVAAGLVLAALVAGTSAATKLI